MNPGDGSEGNGSFGEPFDRRRRGGHRGANGGGPTAGDATLSDALARLVRLLLAGRRTMFAAVALVLVPYQLIAGIYLGRMIDDESIEAALMGLAAPGTLAPIISAAGITMIIGLALSVMVAGAIVATAHAGDLALSVSTALRIGLDRSGATLGAHVLLFGVFMGVLLSATLLVSPLVMIAPPLATTLVTVIAVGTAVGGLGISYLVIPAAVLEARGPVSSLRRGMSIAWRNKSRLVGMMLLVGVALLAVAIIGSVLVALASAVAPAMTVVVDTVFMASMTLISAPVTALAGYVVWMHGTAGELNSSSGRAQ